jgi:hypothetical protein
MKSSFIQFILAMKTTGIAFLTMYGKLRLPGTPVLQRNTCVEFRLFALHYL